MPHCGCAMLLPSFKNPHRRQISANGNDFRVVRQIGHFRQHRTIPALRLKHRSGSCGTASALPKCSIMSGCGTRIVLRGAKAPRILRPLPLLRFAVSATGGAHLCSIQYYLRFWLGICRTSLAVSALRIMRYYLYSWVGRILFFWWYLLYSGVEYWARPVMRDDASIVPYK